MSYTERATCRIDGSQLLEVLNLGEIKLASFGCEHDKVQSAPLVLAKGMGSNLVQLTHTVDPDTMFRKYYYRSSLNEAMREHLDLMFADAMRFVPFKKKPTILDIGCNDGYLLSHFTTMHTIGFDPSNVVIPVFDEDNIVRTDIPGVDKYINDYFSSNGYFSHHRDPADVVFTVAMFYDLDDPLEFIENVSDVLADDGTWIMELHYLPFMLAYGGFDAICHEHLTYWNLHSLKIALDIKGLHIADVAINNVNGGSIRVFIKKNMVDWTPTVTGMYNLEKQQGSLTWFADEIWQNREETLLLLQDLKTQGKTVYGYGASTKGNTILEVYNIYEDLMPAIADRDPYKVGKVMPNGIPIVSEEQARQEADYFFILPYHYTQQFKLREYEWLAKGGKFIVPFPRVTIL